MEKLEGTLADHIKQNISAKPRELDDCIDFSVSIYDVFGVGGKICKNGELTIKSKFLDFTVAQQTVNILNKEYCNTLSIGFEEIRYCFYLKGSCLWTKGYIDGWFHEKQEWNEQIVCL
ncbi:MAG: hypothetical protein AAGU10_12240 [Methanosarcina mazei]|uniref:hypothetical protein n=1 Tax=Methanosarcina soligelidi TaxID=1036677 RepID=UPI00064ECCE4|nr:hypothetical protein [Methanosarcina soligelidi]